jgi:hypothetical protein
MAVRRLPVRPDLEQLHRQARELLRGIHAGDSGAIAELREYHPESIDPSAAKLADAQLVLARSYRASSWTRLIQAVQLAAAISLDDPDRVRALIGASIRTRARRPMPTASAGTQRCFRPSSPSTTSG